MGTRRVSGTSPHFIAEPDDFHFEVVEGGEGDPFSKK